MSSSFTTAAMTSKPGVWVQNVGGKPYIRWWRVLPFIMFCVLAFVVCAVFRATRISPYPMVLTDGVLSTALALVTLAGLSYQLVAIEIERQRVLSGDLRPKIGLATTMLLIFVAAAVFALLGREYRLLQRNREASLARQQFIAGAEAIFRANPDVTGPGGYVQIGPNHERVWVIIYGTRFDNGDLEKLISLSNQSDPRIPITGLLIGGTQIDAAGLRQLAAIPKLTELNYATRKPASVDDETLDAILESAPNLRNLGMNESELKPGQLDRIRERSPNLVFNGYSWKNRDLLQKRKERISQTK